MSDGRRKAQAPSYEEVTDGRRRDGSRQSPHPKTARQRNHHSILQLWPDHDPYTAPITRLDIHSICRLDQIRLTCRCHCRRACSTRSACASRHALLIVSTSATTLAAQRPRPQHLSCRQLGHNRRHVAQHAPVSAACPPTAAPEPCAASTTPTAAAATPATNLASSTTVASATSAHAACLAPLLALSEQCLVGCHRSTSCQKTTPFAQPTITSLRSESISSASCSSRKSLCQLLTHDRWKSSRFQHSSTLRSLAHARRNGPSSATHTGKG